MQLHTMYFDHLPTPHPLVSLVNNVEDLPAQLPTCVQDTAPRVPLCSSDFRGAFTTLGKIGLRVAGRSGSGSSLVALGIL